MALEHFHWPGNIRELENAIEHSFIVRKPRTKLRSSAFPNTFARPPEEKPQRQPHRNPVPKGGNDGLGKKKRKTLKKRIHHPGA